MERYARMIFILSGCFLLGYYLPQFLALLGNVLTNDIAAELKRLEEGNHG